MPDLKLSKLPERTPVKLTISIAPDLHRALSDYAALYRETYDEDESIANLVPHMLATFLSSDRAFAKARDQMDARGSK